MNGSFTLSSKFILTDRHEIDEGTINEIISQLKMKYTSDLKEMIEFESEKLMMYNWIDAKEYMWYVSKNNDEYKFVRHMANTMSKKELARLLDELHNQTKMDYKKIIVRKYSHDLSNLLTVILINMGYLNDELRDGRITTSDNKTVNQIVQSTLKTSTHIKELIESVRTENEWKPDEVVGEVELNSSISQAIEIVRHQIDHNLIFISNIPPDRIIGMEKSSFIRCIYIIFTNALQASLNETTIADFRIEEDDKYNIFTLIDNGKGFSGLDEDKLATEYYTNKKNQLGLGLTNLEKLISLVHGSISFESNDITKVSFSIPKK
ncbi:MAG: HAMP domain-containing histidine kinase [Candidatus Heimdallarchaeota archaeon]|nr:HAMP domain-containing histidine kinase [Candidatus Heimdallarchaeota archaeon]